MSLWKLAALNPCISPRERETLKQRLSQYHTTVVEKVPTLFFVIKLNGLAVVIVLEAVADAKPYWVYSLELLTFSQCFGFDPNWFQNESGSAIFTSSADSDAGKLKRIQFRLCRHSLSGIFYIFLIYYLATTKTHLGSYQLVPILFRLILYLGDLGELNHCRSIRV